MSEAASVLYDLLEQAGLHAPQRLKALGFVSDGDVDHGHGECSESR
jgi:hypothetical protein